MNKNAQVKISDIIIITCISIALAWMVLFIDFTSAGNFDFLNLTDSTIYDEENNICYAERFGMNLTVFPCVIEDIDGRGITQFVDFEWNGVTQQNVSWVFVYSQNISESTIEVWANISHQVPFENFSSEQYTKNVTNITSFQDYTGTLEINTTNCDYGNENNDFIYQVNQSLATNETDVTDDISNFFCFITFLDHGGGTFEVIGNDDFPFQDFREVFYFDWLDVTHLITYLGSDLFGLGYSYYNVSNTVFNPGDKFETRWTYTPLGQADGKWTIFGYSSQMTIQEAIEQDLYILMDPWWDNSWDKKVQINITSDLIGSDLTDFPVLVKLDQNNFNFSNAQSNGEDIRFLNSTESGELSYEIEFYNASDAYIWVKIPLVSSSSNTNFYLYYNNSAVSDNQAKGAVWSNNYTNVYHFTNFSATGIEDSLGESNLTIAGNPQKVIANLTFGIGPLYKFDGAGDYFFNDSDITPPTSVNYTFEITVRSDVFDSTQRYIGGMGGQSCDTSFGCQSLFFDESANFIVAHIEISEDPTGEGAIGRVAETNVTYYLVMQNNDTAHGLYIDGTHNATGAANQLIRQNNKFAIGTTSSSIGNLVWKGWLDEVRLSNVSRTDDWINATYYSNIDGLLNFGNELALSNNSVSLASPVNNSYGQQNVTFICDTTSNTALNNVTFFIWNASGSVVNDTETQTITGSTNSSNYNYTFSASEDGFFWNCVASDTLATPNIFWAPSNSTLNVDTVVPTIAIDSISTTVGSVTFTFDSSTADANLDSCWYSVFNSSADIDGFNNITYTCNQSVEVTAESSFGPYDLTISGNDSADNEISTTSGFTLTQSAGGSVGRGGGTPPIIVEGEDTKWSMETQEGSGKYELNMISGSSRRKNVLFENLGVNSVTLVLSCEGVLCQYITLEDEQIILPLGLDIKTKTSFEIKLPDEIEKGNYIGNIVATNIENEVEKGILTVEVEVGTFGLFAEILTKLASWKEFGNGFSIPYIIIALGGGLFVGIIGYFIGFRFLKATGFSLSIITGFVFSLLVLIIF